MNRSRQPDNYSSPSKRRIERSPKLTPSPQKKYQAQTRYNGPSHLDPTPQQIIDEKEKQVLDTSNDEIEENEPQEEEQQEKSQPQEKLSRAQLEMKLNYVLNERDTLLNHLSKLIEYEMSEDY